MKRICDWKLNEFEKSLIREKTLRLVPRRIMETRMEGKRARGRPRTSWIDSITSAGKKRNKTLVEMNRLVRNRKEWKSFTERNPTP